MKADTGAGLTFNRLNGGNVSVLILGSLLAASIPVKDGEDRPKLGNVNVEITSDDWQRVSQAMGAHPGLEMSESDKRDFYGDEYDAENNEGETVNRESSAARKSTKARTSTKRARGGRS